MIGAATGAPAPAWRRVLSGVLAGFAVIVVLVTVGTIAAVQLVLSSGDALSVARQMEEGGRTPAPYLALNLLVNLASAAAGGWSAARVARERGEQATRILAAGVLLMGVGAVIIAGGAAPGQPAWYPWATLVVGPLGVLLGGRLAARGAPR